MNRFLFCFLLFLLFLQVAYLKTKSKKEKVSWIDKNTPEDALTGTSFLNNQDLELVFSDEFEEEGRSFKDGHDPKWTALDKDDGLIFFFSF